MARKTKPGTWKTKYKSAPKKSGGRRGGGFKLKLFGKRKKLFGIF